MVTPLLQKSEIMYKEKTSNGIAYTESLAGSEGMAFILFPEAGTTVKMIEQAKRELRDTRDVVRLRIANDDDRDEDYRDDIFRNKAVHHLRWYEIYDDKTSIREARNCGVTVDEFIAWHILPFTQQTKATLQQKYGDPIFQI